MSNPFEASAEQDKALFDRNTYNADVNPFMDPPRRQLMDAGLSRLSMRSFEDGLTRVDPDRKRGSAGSARKVSVLECLSLCGYSANDGFFRVDWTGHVISLKECRPGLVA